MDKQSASMLALYIVVVAAGVAMLNIAPVLGWLQICGGAALFGFRIWWATNRRRNKPPLQ